jgi:hypothetical protein
MIAVFKTIGMKSQVLCPAGRHSIRRSRFRERSNLYSRQAMHNLRPRPRHMECNPSKLNMASSQHLGRPSMGQDPNSQPTKPPHSRFLSSSSSNSNHHRCKRCVETRSASCNGLTRQESRRLCYSSGGFVLQEVLGLVAFKAACLCGS